MDYNSDFRYDLKFGQAGEELVGTILEGIIKGDSKFEVKTDRMVGKTGNLYVEYQSRGKKSGILASEADYWVFVIGTTFISIEKRKLIELIRINKHWRRDVPGGDDNTSLGVLVPVKELFTTKNMETMF